MEFPIKFPGLEDQRPRALVSLSLMVGAIFAGFSITPRPAPEKPQLTYAIPGSTGIPSGAGPVFLLGEDLFPHQCGRAYLDPSGRLALVAYHEATCRLGIQERKAHLLPADLRIPWALMPTADRDRLQQLGGTTLEHLRAVALGVVKAPFFEQDYAPLLQDILRQATRQAWNAPATKQALTRAFDTLDRGPLDQLMQDLLPLVAEHTRNNLWRSLRSAAAMLTGSTDPEQRRALAQAWSEVLTDPRVRDHLERNLMPLLSSPQVMAIGTVLANESVKALIADPRSQQFATSLISDQRFLSLRPVAADAQRLLVALPQSLMRLRFRRDHNPLTTYVLHAQVRDRARFLVLLLTAEQERQFEGQLPPEPMLGRKLP